MSHIVLIETEIRDFDAVALSCRRLSLPPPANGTFELFAATETGCGVQLTDWKYPVVCKLDTGQVRFDNYGGRWGHQSRLDEFFQAYAVEKAKLESRKQGHTVTEQPLADGSIKLTVNVGGAA